MYIIALLSEERIGTDEKARGQENTQEAESSNEMSEEGGYT